MPLAKGSILFFCTNVHLMLFSPLTYCIEYAVFIDSLFCYTYLVPLCNTQLNWIMFIKKNSACVR